MNKPSSRRAGVSERPCISERPRISERARQTLTSPIRKLAYLAKDARERGVDVYHLNIGQPDVKPPQEFFDGLVHYKETVAQYENSRGNEALCREWANFTNNVLGTSTEPDQYLITTGASEALIFAFMVCCNPGEEIIVFEPTYANYIGFAGITGVKLKQALTRIEDDFSLPEEAELTAHISDKTRAILLCSPNNPTGSVYGREDIERIHSLCEEHDLFLIVDETYRELVYDGLEPVSVLQVKPDSERVIVIDSLSKRFSLCGARVGAIISVNQEFLGEVHKIAQARLSAPIVEQYAAAHLLANLPEDFIPSMVKEYELRRNVLYEGVTSIPGIVVHRPSGAFYTVAKLPVDDAEKFAAFLLGEFSHNNATAFVAPAIGFYTREGRGKDKIRLAFVLNTDSLKAACEVLGEGLAVYRSMKHL